MRDSGLRTKVGPKNPHVVAAFFLSEGGSGGDFYETLPAIWKNVAVHLAFFA